MRNFVFFSFLFLFISNWTYSQVQTLSDTFEGNGNISSWVEDDCGLDKAFVNPFKIGINNSATVFKYSDVGGLYANIRFNTSSNFNLISNHTFSIKIYVPSSGITGNQTNKISLKLQNNTLSEPWSSQCEIIKPLILNQWQVVTFNFASDPYLNLDSNSPNPLFRNDFNRVLIQINGENNTDKVVAYIDDFLYTYTDNGPKFNTLVWSDEFEANGAFNANNWFQQTQLPDGGTWFNGEIQHYTNRQTNSFVSNGSLKIVAKREAFTNQGQTKQFTSARLNSKFAFKNGRVEVRAKMPTGPGTFPAIWMLGKNIIEPGSYWTSTYGKVGWPACGEIDIIEHWGTNQNFVQSAMHTPSSFGATVNKGGQTISTVSNEFHVYALEWTTEKMIFSVDGVVHYIYNPTVKNTETWPFLGEQYILLNVAMLPSVTPNFSQSTMEIDYVRVYQESQLATSKIGKLNNVVLSPNPATDELIITVNEELLGASAKIYSLLGQELQSLQLSNQQNIIDVSNYQKGIYLIGIESKKGTKTYKFIKN
ncbi:family 16 glycosylhydrolase [Flavobacterium luteum]|uniref:Family 16 glycosylhydrolase n=1 Tax=Flavobacterium luteum TaxID=2026654 RepID=A0A7J5AFC4_9FLAO|nr:family 16 glycosylhydrolase [Flavobacterium luteum]KAB1155689.1 family 16 glycosylhydrolase [Flavobacterium luteum]